MKQFKPAILLAAVLLVAGASVPSGEKELIIRLQGEVIVLQRQIRDLQESFDRWQGQSGATLQKLSENSSTTARDISAIDVALRNSRTAQSNNLAGTNASLQRITEILTGQRRSFDQLGSQLDSLGKSIREIQQQNEKKTENRDIGMSSPEAIYASGYTAYLKGDYQAAIRHLRAFLQAEPNGEDSDDAIYWIGESLFAGGRYGEALNEYDTILRDHPNGDRARAALLRRGLSLLHLERRDEGIAVLRSVVDQFPQSREAGLATEELRRLGA